MRGSQFRAIEAGEGSAGGAMFREVKVVVEKHADGHVAYPIGLKGVVVGEGDNDEGALADVRSAIAFHVETFGPDAIETDQPALSQSGIQRDDFLNVYGEE